MFIITNNVRGPADRIEESDTVIMEYRANKHKYRVKIDDISKGLMGLAIHGSYQSLTTGNESRGSFFLDHFNILSIERC